MKLLYRSLLAFWLFVGGSFSIATTHALYAKDTSNLIPIEAPITIIPSHCIVTGCSNQLCVDASKGPLNTTCEWKEEYSCLPHAACEKQSDSTCGWTFTPEYNQCRGVNLTPVPTSPQPTTTPSQCGNKLCEIGEADSVTGGCPNSDSTICLGPPLAIISGTCPHDCPTDATSTITHVPNVTSSPSAPLRPTVEPLISQPFPTSVTLVNDHLSKSIAPGVIQRDKKIVYPSNHFIFNNVPLPESLILPNLYHRVLRHIQSVFTFPSFERFSVLH